MKKASRGAAAPIAPIEQTIATDAGVITPPVVSGADIEGTISSTTPSADPKGEPEPIMHPAEGGRYLRDPETGHLTRLED